MSEMRHRRAISRSEFLRLLGVSGVALAFGETTASGALESLTPGAVHCRLTPNVLLVGRRNVFRAEVFGLEAPGLNAAPARASCMTLDGAATARGATTFQFDGIVPSASEPVAGITSVVVEGRGWQAEAPAMLLRPEQCLIYRTSVRGRKACRSCRDHAANIIYASEEAAEAGRPHARCACPIVSEKTSWEFYARAFWPTAPGAGVFHDRRWGWPAAIPTGLTVSGPRG
jgi:hypothetical protein